MGVFVVGGVDVVVVVAVDVEAVTFCCSFVGVVALLGFQKNVARTRTWHLHAAAAVVGIEGVGGGVEASLRPRH